MYNELNSKLESEKQSYTEIINQKKDLSETVINLEKQVKSSRKNNKQINFIQLISKNSDLMENLNAQINVNNQLKTQYNNLLRVQIFTIFKKILLKLLK